MEITFLACLKQSGKAIKLGADGDSEIVLEADSQQLASVMVLMTKSQEVFKITIEEVGSGE